MNLTQELTNAAHATALGHALPEDDELGECMKLIRKLRWIGLEDEAERLQRSLSRVAPEQRGTVLADPDATD